MYPTISAIEAHLKYAKPTMSNWDFPDDVLSV